MTITFTTEDIDNAIKEYVRQIIDLPIDAEIHYRVAATGPVATLHFHHHEDE